MDDRFRASRDPRFERTRQNRSSSGRGRERASPRAGASASASADAVAADARFSAMFTEPDFAARSQVDRRGKRVSGESGSDLRKFYALPEPEKQNKHKNKNKKSTVKRDAAMEAVLLRARGEVISSSSSSSSSSAEQEELEAELSLSSSSEDLELSDDSVVEGDEESEESDDGKTVLVKHASDVAGERVEIGDASRRLAVMNMDWTNVRAVDLLVLFRSFGSPESVTQVSIFPSEFGKKMMREEELRGPTALWVEPAKGEDGQPLENDDDSDADASTGASSSKKNSDFDLEKLREYELSKLKYYYAVIECDSVETAERIYAQCDGMELEHSGNMLDLRYIPDDFVTPSRREAHDTAFEVPKDFNMLDFATNVIQSSNVKCTWDDDMPDTHRASVTMRGLTSDVAGAHTRDEPKRKQRGQLLQSRADARRITEEEEAYKAYLAGNSSSESSSEDVSGESTDLSSSSDSDNATSSDEAQSIGSDSKSKPTKGRRAERKALRKQYRGLLEGTTADPFGKSRRASALSDFPADAAEEDDADAQWGDMEISFKPGLTQVAQELIEEKSQRPASEASNAWEERISRMRERKAAKKKQLKERIRDSKEQQKEETREHRDKFSKQRKNKESAEERKERETIELLTVPEDDEGIRELQERRRAKTINQEGGVETMAQLLAMQENGEPLSKRQKRLLVKHAARKRKRGETDGGDGDTSGFKLDLKDDRFAELFTDPDFEVQTDHKQFKRQDESTTKLITRERIAKRRRQAEGRVSSQQDRSTEKEGDNGLAEQIERVKNRLKSHPVYARR